jgi:hypothetical protein
MVLHAQHVQTRANFFPKNGLFLYHLIYFKTQMSLTETVLARNAEDPLGYLTIPIDTINQSGCRRNLGPNKNKPYFFIPTFGERIRHCRIYKNQFLDYTAQRGGLLFPTLEEWAQHSGVPVELIYFGFETDNPLYGKVNVTSYFTDDYMFDTLKLKLHNMNLGFKNLAVVTNNRVVMADEFMEGH